MDFVNEGDKFILLDNEGKVICVDNNKLVHLPIRETNKDNVFMFWSCDLKELEDYIKAFGAFKKDNPFEELDLSGVSFLGINFEEDGSVTYG